jgi:hypothetical protein
LKKLPENATIGNIYRRLRGYLSGRGHLQGRVNHCAYFETNPAASPLFCDQEVIDNPSRTNDQARLLADYPKLQSSCSQNEKVTTTSQHLTRVNNFGANQNNISFFKYSAWILFQSYCAVRFGKLISCRTRLILLLLIMPWFSNQSAAQTQTQTFTTNGTFTVPPGITSITVECWGGGGGGGGAATSNSAVGGGGGGGAYTLSTITVTPGTPYTVTVGTGGTAGSNTGGNGGNGGSSSFPGATTAVGGSGGRGSTSSTPGAGGAGGSAGATHSGGNGATGTSNSSGGGGGGSAGTTANGGNGNSNGTAGTAGVSFGGAGGAGATTNAAGVAGTQPGGGGGGGRRASSNQRGGTGAAGQVIIIWTCSLNVSNFQVSATPVCQGNASTVTVTSSTLATGTYTVYYNLTGVNSAPAQSATMNFTAGSPGSGTFSTIGLANSGTTTLEITTVGCAIVSSNKPTITVTEAPSNIRITFAQFEHRIDFTTYVPCGIIDPGNQNDLDICISSYPGCSGSYNPVAGDTYQWEVGLTPTGPFTHNGIGPTSRETQFVLDPDSVNYLMVAGDYYFQLLVTRNGCTGRSVEVAHLHVNVSSNLTGGTIAKDQTFPCGGSATPARLTGTPAIGGYTDPIYGKKHYQWQYSTNGIDFTDFSTRDTLRNYFDPPTITQTTWYRRYVVSGGCRSYSNAVKVTLNVTPQPGPISGPTPVCAGSTGLVYNIAAVTGATNYNWTVPAGWIKTSDTGTTAITVTAGSLGQNGNIEVTAYVPACGTSTPSILPVAVATPVSLTVNSTSIVEGCTGQIILQRQSTDLTQPATVNLSYSGTATNGTDVQISPGGSPLPASVTIPAGQSSYTINYIAVNDSPLADAGEVLNIQLSQLCPCSTYPECSTKAITIYEPLAITATASNVACGTSNGSITVLPSHGSPDIKQFCINGGPWQNSNLFTGLAPGTYTIRAHDPGSCVDPNPILVTVSAPVDIIADAGPDVTVCSGDSVQLQGSGGTIYTWSPSDGLSDPNIANPFARPASTTQYTLTVQVPKPGGGYCTGTDDMTITVIPKPVAAIDPASNTICNGSSVTLTASGEVTYTWISPPVTGPSITVTPTADASYTVVVTAANGCTSNATANVAVHPLSTAVLSGVGNICIGDAATINVSLTGSGPWTVTYTDGTTPVTTPPISSYSYDISVSPLTTTTYALVSATDAYGCVVSLSGSATVTVTPVPVIRPSPQAVCSAYGLYETFSIEFIPGVTYQWQESRDNGLTWNDLIYNVWYQYWGIRNNTLMVWTPDGSKNGYRYHCVVTSSCVRTSGDALLTVYETPYVDLPLTASFCTGSTITLTPILLGTDDGPFAWEWYKNNTLIQDEVGSTLVVSSAGDYQVKVTNLGTPPPYCSWKRVPVTVTEYPVMPAVDVSISANPSTTICSGTSVTFTATPNYPYDQAQWQSQLVYQWQKNGDDVGGNSNTYNYDGLVTGDVITCTLTVNNLLCSPSTQATSDPITMTVNPNIPVGVSITASQEFPVCPGTQVTFTATLVNGGTAPSFQWYKDGIIITGETGQTYTPNALVWGDAYAITCKLTSSLTVPCIENNPATSTAISVSVKPPPPIFNVYSYGSACESGGVTIYTDYSDPYSTYYLQRDGSDIVPVVSLPGKIDFSSVYFPPQFIAGVYTVRAEYNGCSRLMDNSVTIENTLPTIVLGANPSVCIGSTPANLSYSGPTGSPDQYSIVYDVAAHTAGFVDVTNAALPSSPIVLLVPGAATAGTYSGTLTVRNSTSGCVSVGYPISVTINALPAAYAVTGGGAYCSGGSGVAVGLANSQIGVNYQLFNGASPVGTAVAGTGSAISFGNQTTAGTYTVVATNPTTTCTQNMTGSATITVNALPAAYAVTGGGAYCSGGAGVTVGLANSQVGVNYQLFNGASPVGSPVAGTGSAISFGNQTTAGTYTVVATNTTTTCTQNMTGSATITINVLPAAVAGANRAICLNASTTIGAASVPGSTYSWTSVPAGFTSTAANPTVSPLVNTTYTVVETITATGCTNTHSVVVIVNALPAAVAGADRAICLNASTTIGAAAVPGSTYSWTSVPAGFTSTAANPTVSPTVNTTYTVVETITATGCTNAHSIAVTVNPLPTITGSQNVCPGKTTPWIANPSGGSWQSNNIAVASVDNNGLVTGVASGTTSITYTDNNGCSKSMTIQVGDLVTISQQPVSKSGCYGSSITFSASYNTYSGSVMFNWYRKKPDGTIKNVLSGTINPPTHSSNLTLSNIGANGDDIDQSQYWVEFGPSDDGCMTPSGIATLTVNTPPICSINGGVDALCAGSTTIWSATAGMTSYSWTGPGGYTASTKDITIGMAGTYTVTITDANGCQSSCSRILTVNPLPTTSAIYHQ